MVSNYTGCLDYLVLFFSLVLYGSLLNYWIESNILTSLNSFAMIFINLFTYQNIHNARVYLNSKGIRVPDYFTLLVTCLDLFYEPVNSLEYE
jgi:hypothetical protein